MDRDYDGRLSFGEFMGEETPLEKVLIVNVLGVECLGNYWENNVSGDDLEVVLGVQEYGQGWKWNNYKVRNPKDL